MGRVRERGSVYFGRDVEKWPIESSVFPTTGGGGIVAVGALHSGARPDNPGGDGIAEKDRPGAGAAAGYAKFCRPCVVATVDSLQAPRAGAVGR